MTGPIAPAALLRGAAAGLFTAMLSVAGHTAAGGAAPAGPAVVVLAILAVTVGALAATLVRADDVRVLLALLTAGQLAGHLVLESTGHHQTGVPTAMLAAHAVAVTTGAVLIAVGGRLCAAVSRIVRAAVRPATAPVVGAMAHVTGSSDQPWRSALQLAASVSHRGPPCGLRT